MGIISRVYTIAVLLFVTAIVFSCSSDNNLEIKSTSNSFFSYKLDARFLTAIQSKLYSPNNLVILSSGQKILIDFDHASQLFRMIDILSDTVLKVVHSPFLLKKVKAISLFDTENFAAITDTVFYVYSKGILNAYSYNIFNCGYVPLSYVNILYNPINNTIISAGLTYKKKSKVSYSSEFLVQFNLNDTTCETLPLNYPQVYHGMKQGIPKFFLSQYDNNLLVSFELIDTVYQINLKTKLTDRFLVKSNYSQPITDTFPKSSNKQIQIDFQQNACIQNGKYGVAFYNPKSNQIYRTFKPALPSKSSEGSYYNTFDAGWHIVCVEMKSNTTREYKLPNGQYYMPQCWAIDTVKNQLIYPNKYEDIRNENIYHYCIHYLSLFTD